MLMDYQYNGVLAIFLTSQLFFQVNLLISLEKCSESVRQKLSRFLPCLPAALFLLVSVPVGHIVERPATKAAAVRPQASMRVYMVLQIVQTGVGLCAVLADEKLLWAPQILGISDVCLPEARASVQLLPGAVSIGPVHAHDSLPRVWVDIFSVTSRELVRIVPGHSLVCFHMAGLRWADQGI